ncbi:MAG: molecular chaperone HtpG [Rhodanobacteraceae bacterium]|nr:molecular chaperone HtpG [Xanthomonadales bacterium]MCP5478818.1 molecular chaperone HtpG [Rhodanobacteraceae bacterium]HPF73422.1 molecular chaperone HtpG [Xanthomonadaceae bacterium]HRX99817.1 molecular chaperone HtpG [Xanthomonadaceae bacterium]
MSDTTADTIETRPFEAEVAQVLHLVTHSLYSNKDVVLRELISNASDACDKLRFEALADESLYAGQADLRIDIRFDAEARTLSVIDTGIGMSREELIENLGTIARSGTRKFLEAMAESQRADAALIGQFGVGFYSAFVIADKVSVTTRRAGSDDAWRWESDGASAYTLEAADGEVPRGTQITLHLKGGEDEFLAAWKLRSLVQRYSDHIGFPIRMAKLGDDGKPGDEMETVNQAAALWTRAKSEITDEEYQAFYKHISHDFNDALSWSHNRVEGNQNFTSLLFVPAKAPFDMAFGRDERQGLKLYVKRVFIMDAAEQMLPNYLRFVRGVVDSDDLPLNVSREILQSNRQVERIKGALVKRTLDILDRVAGDEDGSKYLGFWGEFGNVLKEGIVEDASNRERIAKLLRFPTTQSANADELHSLDDVIGRMKLGQEGIYYLTADGWNAARNSPQLEALKARGVEVVLMHERVDEWMIGYLSEYAGKPLKNIAKGDLKLDELPEDESSKQAREEAAEQVKGAVEKLKTALGDRVADVKLSTRLTDSASCLVLGEHDMALHMQRLLKAAGHDAPAGKPTLEVNPRHALVKRFDAETDPGRASDLALLLLEQAQLAEGAQLDDPAGFLKRVNSLIG